MIVPDALVYIAVLLSAAFLTDMSFDFLPLPQSDPSTNKLNEGWGLSDLGRIATLVRGLGFPLIAGIFWVVLGIFTATISNCNASFVSCYSDPGQTTLTSTVTAPYFSIGLSWLFIAVGLFMWIYAIVILIVFPWAMHAPKRKGSYSASPSYSS